MRTTLIALMTGSLLFASVTRAQASFSVVLPTSCEGVYAELDALSAAAGPYSIRLDERSDAYLELEATLADIAEKPVPYVGAVLAPVPRMDVTGLRPTTRTVRRTVASPRVAEGLLSMGLGGGMLYVALTSEDSESTAIGALGLILFLGGMTFFTSTTTVSEEVVDDEAIRENSAIRARVEAENRRIDATNADRRNMRAEQERIVQENVRTAESRVRLDAQLASYEAESRRLFDARVSALQEGGQRRCIADLATSGVLLRFRGELAEVYVVTRPLNRSGELVTDAATILGLRVTVSHASLLEPLGEIARLAHPVVVPLQRPSAFPHLGLRDVGGFVATLSLPLDYAATEPQRITAAVRISIEQEGRDFEASTSEIVRLVE